MRVILRASLLLLAILPSYGIAQAPLAKDSATDIVLQRARIEQRISLGTTALETGLASLAAKSFGQVLNELTEEDPRYISIRLKWVSALLARGSFQLAEKALSEGEVPNAPAWKLRQSMLDLALGQRASASGRLQGLHENDFSEEDQPWFLYVRGVLQWDAGAQETGLVLMDRAVELAKLPVQRIQMELAAYQRRVFAGPVNLELIEALRKKVDSFQGQRSGFQFAQEFALALHKNGNKEEALAVLEKHLSLLPVDENIQRSQLLLLVGILSPEGGGRGFLALKELIRTSKDRRISLLGLHLLLKSWPDDTTSKGDWINYLSTLLSEVPEHPLRGEFLLLLAQAAFEQEKVELARQTADAFLQGFPQAENVPNALRLLACISLSSQPPQYRTAAAFLSRIRDKLQDPADKLHLSVQLADCHFLAGDYEIAATLYANSAKQSSDEATRAILKYQHILALISNDRLDLAEDILGTLDPLSPDYSVYRWRAEWNLVSKMKSAGRIQEAFSRVRDLIKAGELQSKDHLPHALVMRLRWLEAHLALELGRPSEASQYSDNLLETLDAVPEGKFKESDHENLFAGALMLKARALLAQNDYEASEPVLAKLREDYSKTSFAQRSYLLEASFHYHRDDLVRAQQLNVKLADDYPDNTMAPLALLEAAQFAEKRGSENFYKEALSLLERLTSQYPSHELVYYARLRQGHLFRKLNQFGNAQQIYANLLNQYPEHPELHLALLSNADCQLAQAGDDLVRFEVAIKLLERLFLQPDLPPDVSVEAGYKLAFAHRQIGKSPAAQEVLGSNLDRFLLNPEEKVPQLGARGRYWMSRSILELGNLLEEVSVLDEAKIVYGLIEEKNLPGRGLANSRINQLGI